MKLETCADVKEKAWGLVHRFAEEGCQVKIWHDGYADILKADGTKYHIYHWRCNCPDAERRNGGSYEAPGGKQVCKHVLVTMLGRPCEHCGRTMVLRDNGYFECDACGNARDERVVKAERNARRVKSRRVA